MSENTESSVFVRTARWSIPIVLTLLYAFLTRVAFTWEPLQGSLHIVSLTFVSLLPVGMGALVTFLGWKVGFQSIAYALVAPPVVMVLGISIAYGTGLEAMICIIMAVPIMTGGAIGGGALMFAILNYRGSGSLQVSFLVLLPFLVSPLEEQWEKPMEMRTIENRIDIAASPEIVWQNIASVEAIPAEKIPDKWIYWLDFPKPIAATLDRPGIGGIRTATFERNVSFHEVVTHWEPRKKLSFSINADPEFIPATAFDQHILVGGRFFDVLDGTYELESNGEGTTLVLSSQHRLSTPFNSYAGLWSKWIMEEIQDSILQVLKERCELAYGSTDASTRHR